MMMQSRKLAWTWVLALSWALLAPLLASCASPRPYDPPDPYAANSAAAPADSGQSYLAVPALEAAVADFEVQPAPADSWQVTFTPYLWIPDVDGDVGRSGGSRTATVSSDKVPLEDADISFAFMGHLEAQKGGLSWFLDGSYVAADSSHDASRRILNDFGTLDAELDMDLEVALVEIGGAWKTGEFASFDCKPSTFELLGGLRWNHLDVDLSLETAAAGPRQRFENEFDSDFSLDFVDPFVGARTRVPLGEAVSLHLRGDVGGFGVGSDLAWNVVTGVVVTVSDTVDLFAGYRWYDLDVDESGHELDVQLAGPTIAVAIRF